MIGTLTGTVGAIEGATAIIDVHGIGFEVRMPQGDLATMHTGQDATVHTILSVGQDAVTLFGFLSVQAKRMFLQLQKVSGIGPKVALSLLSTLPPAQLAQAIHQEDAAALAKAPGLGRKGAQKIILELKGSIDLAADGDGGAGEGPTAARKEPEDAGALQVVEGLVSLGWRYQDAQAAVDRAIRDHDIAVPLRDEDIPTVLRLALASFDRGR
ncbi:MAG: Holliday junction branch migration protein RuvA [Bifidobacterium sp.]|nr:Holliday junction branch migration protein RuvA [Bifidobacterium sp.]